MIRSLANRISHPAAELCSRAGVRVRLRAMEHGDPHELTARMWEERNFADAQVRALAFVMRRAALAKRRC